ncbi:hypothetical protein PGT21_016727 [Puccinia graminis f. sp. tritici]|uniref:Uncharacterized protein n=1 Tax=Puccinia graminis f. sp. tritici TaxID=56615 RepID=A0A5B0MDL1_PUCGR|nr:hypothetical protein PGT21_016727 [Puccinia graminis f. sp. tritici]KAA1115865.1 hypothetical protein PGTUg99_007933 [Puccinia graminis f. sp. tritici]
MNFTRILMVASFLSGMNCSKPIGIELTRNEVSENEWIHGPGVMQSQTLRGEWGEKKQYHHTNNMEIYFSNHGLRVSKAHRSNHIFITNQGQSVLEYLLIDSTGSQFLSRRIQPYHQDKVSEHDADFWVRRISLPP